MGAMFILCLNICYNKKKEGGFLMLNLNYRNEDEEDIDIFEDEDTEQNPFDPESESSN